MAVGKSEWPVAKREKNGIKAPIGHLPLAIPHPSYVFPPRADTSGSLEIEAKDA